MKFRRSFREETTQTSRAQRVLRKTGIGPRLLLFVALPIVALIAVIGLLAADDVVRAYELRGFTEDTQQIEELVELRTALQEERSLLLNPDAPTVLVQPINATLNTLLIDSFRFSESSVDPVQLLPDARRLGESGQTGQAATAYTTLISELGRLIDAALAEAPLGEPDLAADAVSALLASQESLLQEDLEIQLGSANPTTLGRHREEALVGLQRFGTIGSDSGREQLEAITASSAWRFLNLSMIDSLATIDDPATLAQWQAAADVRRLSMIDLTTREIDQLQSSMREVRNAELVRLGVLLGIIFAVLTIAFLGTFQLRRSILGPLSSLSHHARNLSRGEVTAVDDPASDEIAEVGEAFSNVAATVEHLFNDIDQISESMMLGDHDQRIDTTPLEGDWERLADTMNRTLATSSAHHVATNAELARRTVMG